ncbi:tripartite tricarboxylate transporter permease [Nocardiopsis oceani]
MLEALMGALQQVISPESLMMLLIGVLLGFVVGILPGLGGAVALAMLLPFTFGMDPLHAFALLLGVYIVTSTTGDITSVLFGVPGDATSAAVVLDGYPMTKRGLAGRALGTVLIASGVGGLFGVLVLLVAIPVMRPLTLAIGPPEYVGLVLLGLMFVVTLSGRHMGKGLLMAALGILIALVGLDPNTGAPRYTFDQLHLWAGVSIVPVVIGLFGGSEVLQTMLKKRQTDQAQNSKVVGVRQGASDVARHWPAVLRSSALGSGIGIVPGVGGSVSQFIAYGFAKQTSKEPERFGKGSPEGLIAASAPCNAKDSGALIPTIAFGIPGSASSAVLLGAFLILGIEPGAEMLTTNLDLTLSMVWLMAFATVASVAASLLLLKPLAKLTRVSGAVLAPILLVLLAVGAFSASNSFADVWVMLVFTAIGLACTRWDWPKVPLLLGLVLGGILERYVFLSNSIFGSAWLTRPTFLAFLGCIVLLLAAHFYRENRTKRRKQQEHKEVSA